ncbi:hypothetical protein KR074_009733 [Drosophila pseudoananassae]|nr:hypothetical protein KR074_009733 [Drosophila pseudoananassae]
MKYSTEATFVSKEAEKKEIDTFPSVDEAVAYLQIRVFGMHMNDTYRSNCASILREYLTKRKRLCVMDEWAIVKDALQMHYATIDKVVKWDMQAVMRYNDGINFVQRKTVRLGNWIVTIPFTTMELNKVKHTENKWTLTSIFVALLKMIILGLVAEYAIFPIILFFFYYSKSNNSTTASYAY